MTDTPDTDTPRDDMRHPDPLLRPEKASDTKALIEQARDYASRPQSVWSPKDGSISLQGILLALADRLAKQQAVVDAAKRESQKHIARVDEKTKQMPDPRSAYRRSHVALCALCAALARVEEKGGWSRNADQDALCAACEHAYERHFDWAEAYRPGCKYCPCSVFLARVEEK